MNITQNESEFVSNNFSCGKWNLTKEENDFQEIHGWWVQSLASLVIGSFGILVNMVTIVVLSTAGLRKLFFNKLLIGLTLFDNLFLLNCLYESVRLHIIKTDYCALHGHLLIVLRPFRYISMCCSIYMTLVLTFERYLAVVRPIRHRNRFIGSSHGKRLIKYVSPVVILSILFCTPQFFALNLEYFNADSSIFYDAEQENLTSSNLTMTYEDILNVSSDFESDEAILNNSNLIKNIGNNRISDIPINNYSNELSEFFHNNSVADSQIFYCLRPAKIMFDRNYVLWYKNVANLIITGFVPFFLLAFFNYKIYMTTKSALQTRGELFLTVECTSVASNATTHKTTITSKANGSTHCVLSRGNSILTGIGEEDLRMKGQNHCKEQKSEEHSQATVLLGIVITFLICHVLRIVLNVEEIVTFEELSRIREEAEKLNEVCSGVQLWTMLTNDLSHLLLQLNSSITFFIYIYFSTQFKEASKSIFLEIARCLHVYHRDPSLDILNEQGKIIGRRYLNHGSINTKTTNSLSTPQATIQKRKRSKNQSLKLLTQQRTQTMERDECIIQTNANSTFHNHHHHDVVLEKRNCDEIGHLTSPTTIPQIPD